MNPMLSTLAILLSATAFAATTEKWSGTGTEFAPNGSVNGTYQMSIVNTSSSPGVVDSDAWATTPEGHQTEIKQKLTFNGNQWSDVSNLGTGGGACYGSDTCENYIAGPDGMAFATTIINDSPSTRRQLTVVLKNGSPVKVLRENLTRVQ